MMNLQFNMKDNGFRGELSYGEINVSGNEQYGHRPGELMVTSIAVCSGGVLRKILEKKRMDIEDIVIKADVTRNENEANRIEKIHLHFIIKGQGLVEDRIHKAMEMANKNCPMVQSVKDCIQITETSELVNVSM